MAIQITMTGGSPWGFKMTGGKDFRQPLAIGKVNPSGKAFKSGVTEGYIIEKVNGEEFSNLSHHEAQNKIKGAGFTLTLTLSKPKPRDDAPAQPAPVSVNNQPSYKPVEYKPPKATHYHRYNKPDSYQNDNHVAQSPAYYAKSQPANATKTSDEDKNVLSITPEIKQMIEEEEAMRNAPSAKKTDEPKRWHLENQNGVNSTSPPPTSEQQNKSKAASNIDKFFQSSSAPRYGEPTFSKTLQDVARPFGDPIVLEIRLGSNLPVPTVHWYHNNRPAKESKEKDIRCLNNGPVHTLVLGELTPELLGTYTCTILNKNGSKSCRCTVSAEPSSDKTKSSPSPYSGPLRSPTGENKRVVPSNSLGLYSSRNAQESYQGQMNRKSSRDSNEESEVLKALREQSPPRHQKTPSMKYLEETYTPESGDL